MKKYFFYILFLVVTVVGYIAVEYKRPKPINWTQTFSERDKIPYGTSALIELLPSIFDGQKTHIIRKPLYNFLTEDSLPKQFSYLSVNGFFQADTNDLAELYRFVGKEGNQAFLVSNDFPEKLKDTLHIKVEEKDLIHYFKLDSAQKKSTIKDISILAGDSIKLSLLNPKYQTPLPYFVPRQTGEHYLITNDTTQALALGSNKTGEYNFLKIKFGKGYFFLHTVPEAFSNYFLLSKQNSHYTFNVLSYLPANQPIYWDEYQKQGREGEDDIFRFMKSNEALRWVYYLLLYGIIIYMIFQGKRRQRIIPIIEPLKNTSLAFVQTIGNLYYQRQDHTNIAQKKIAHFFAYIRQHFHLQTNVLDQEFVENLALKSGQSFDSIKDITDNIKDIQRHHSLSEQQLISISNQIEVFYKQARK
jgi:hypothetical protein